VGSPCSAAADRTVVLAQELKLSCQVVAATGARIDD
jgi:hypothetical protein